MPFTKGHPGYTPKLSEQHKEKISKANKGKKGLKGKDNPKWKGEKPRCSVCGKTLTKHYSWLTKEQLAKKKCWDCYSKSKIGEGNHNWKGGQPKCISCGKTISYNAKKQMCIKCYGISSRGENHPKWKGENAKESSKFSRERKSPALLKWKRDIIRRDGLKCSVCGYEGAKRSEMHVDHIKSFAKYPKLRTELSNGRVLCKNCHRKTKSYSVKVSKPKENRVNSGEVQNG